MDKVCMVTTLFPNSVNTCYNSIVQEQKMMLSHDRVEIKKRVMTRQNNAVNDDDQMNNPLNLRLV